MASLAVQTVISSILSTNWTYTTIYSANATAAPPDGGGAFMTVLYPIAEERQLSFGTSTNTYEETGACRVGLYVPIGEGINPVATPWTTRIETLMGFFRGEYTSGIEFLGFVGPTIYEDSDDGAYFEISFAVSYRRLFSA